MAVATNSEDGSIERPFTVRQGRTLTLEVQVETYEGRPYDLTGRTGRGHMRFNLEDIVEVAAFTVTLTSPTRGVAEAVISAEVVEGIDPGFYVADFEFELDSTDVIGSGTYHIQVTRGITR